MQFVENIKRLTNAELSHPSPGGAFRILSGGYVAEELLTGVESLSCGHAINEKTKFHAASLAKQFTAYLVCIAIKDNKISKDTLLVDLLPEFEGEVAHTTISQLLNHTSGIIDQWTLTSFLGKGPGDAVDTEFVIRLLRKFKHLNFSSGKNFIYCNSGYTILSVILEKVYNQPFQRIAHEKIFKKLGMNNSLFPASPYDAIPNRAVAYLEENNRFIEQNAKYAVNGATSLFTTIEDLTIWVNSIYNQDNEFFEDALQYRSTLDTDFGYHNGLFVLNSYKYRLIGHGGNDFGFYSAIYHDPESGTSIIGLSNCSLHALEFETIEALSQYTLGNTAVQKSLSEAPQVYEGYYANNDYSDVRKFSYKNNLLLMFWGTNIALEYDKVQQCFKNKTGSVKIIIDSTTENAAARIISKNWVGETTLTLLNDSVPKDEFELDGVFISKELGVSARLMQASSNSQEFWLGAKNYGPIEPVTRDLFMFNSYWAKVKRRKNGTAYKLELSHPRARRVEFVKARFEEYPSESKSSQEQSSQEDE